MNEIEKKKMKTMSIVLAIILYAIFIGVNFDPNVTAVQAKVVGDNPLGIPVRTFFIILNMILFFPIFFVSKHFINISTYALSQGKSIRPLGMLIYVFSIGNEHPAEIRKSKNIFLLSLLYLILVFAAWIILTSIKGV